jgi:hypothetical protein
MKAMHKTKKQIDVDEDEPVEDGRTERRLNYSKDEDIILVSNLLSFFSCCFCQCKLLLGCKL